MKNILRPALVLFALLTLLTGVAYPLLVTGLANTVFPAQAHGSLIQRNGVTVGSSLIGQHFTAPDNFWSRPSATGPGPNNAAASGGSNQGPLNPALADAVTARLADLKTADPSNVAPIPVDLVTASGSGLDPHISVAAAMYQVNRVARARQLSTDVVQQLVALNTHTPFPSVLGEPVVNVLELNLALQTLK